MKTLYTTKRNLSPLLVDDKTNSATELVASYLPIRDIFVAPDDLEIRKTGNKSKQVVLKAQKGDLIITFYDDSGDVIVVKNEDLKNKTASINEARKCGESQCKCPGL